MLLKARKNEFLNAIDDFKALFERASILNAEYSVEQDNKQGVRNLTINVRYIQPDESPDDYKLRRHVEKVTEHVGLVADYAKLLAEAATMLKEVVDSNDY